MSAVGALTGLFQRFAIAIGITIRRLTGPNWPAIVFVAGYPRKALLETSEEGRFGKDDPPQFLY
jgi:hypothetical protein